MLQKCVKEILSCVDVVLCTLTGASPEGALRYISLLISNSDRF